MQKKQRKCKRRKKLIIDVTGTPLKPSWQGMYCPGNGKHPRYECCCDECGYFMYCYPQLDPWSKVYKYIQQKKKSSDNKN